jgi:hypothetical protein
MRRAILGVLTGITVLALAGCGDDPLPTQPPMPLDVSGPWQGTATTRNLRSHCGNPEPVMVSATFTQAGTQVTGTFVGGCLNGATFEGQARDQRLAGVTHFAGSFSCFGTGAGATAGPGSASRLSLDVTVFQNPLSGTCPGLFGNARGTLSMELSR